MGEIAVKAGNEERVTLSCRRGLMIEPKRESAEKFGFLPKGHGRVRTLERKDGKVTYCLYPKCESCGYGSKLKAVCQEEDGSWNWNCEIKSCMFKTGA